MRLRLFDRIRRLAHSRRPPVEAASGVSGVQGRHRRSGRRRPAPAGPAPGAPPAELAHTAVPWPGGPAAGQAPFPPGGPSGPADLAPPDRSPDRRPSDGRLPDSRPPAERTGAGPGPPASGPPAPRSSRGAGSSAQRAGAARARIRDAPQEAARPVPAAPAPQAHWQETEEPSVAAARAEARADALARVAAGVPHQPDGLARSSWRPAVPLSQSGLPYATAHPREQPRIGDGRRNCGSLEAILWRQWDPASPPPREVVMAVDRLAELPFRIKEKLADGLDAIFIGPGGVPELDDMTSLHGVPLPSGRATWDACAGAYGERKIVVGSRPSPTPDVMCHEVGHALDDLDSPPGQWQSDSAEFRMLYDQCESHFASDFHRQPGGLGRKEFFADAFAAIASRQRPALVDMLNGDTRTALRVMLYFNRRYGI
jgi:hypothetical protein